MNIFLVLASSSSVAAWAIWKQFPLLWLFIFGISQVLVLIKPYVLFPKYIKVFNEKSIYWQELSTDLEELWHKINFKIIDEQTATDKLFELKRKADGFDNTPDDIIFFNFKRFQKNAEQLVDIYLQKL
jgi:hypothetical protein